MIDFNYRVTSYVSKARAEGMADEQIKSELLKSGWGASDIEKALGKMSDTAASSEQPNESFSPPSVRRSFVTISALVVVILVLTGGIGMLWSKQIDLTQKNSTAVNDFFVHLAEGQVGFVDAAGLVYPDEQKFLDTKQLYIQQKNDFVEADLDAMRLHLYQGGVAVKDFPIIAKGRDGSWWETPTGSYRALSKEPNHFSSIGKVWMPWSIQFHGNFFIHGWPYYDNGDLVPAGHSGGCIRLSTEDAKELYQYVNKGTSILVKESMLSSKFGSATVQGGPPHSVSASAFLVANISTGETLIEKTDGRIVSVASPSKLMTAVIASELIYLERAISVNSGMLASIGSVFDPKVGEQYLAFDLLYPLLMQSSSQSANIIAGFIGHDKFLEDMNQKAVSLGMTSTRFEDLSGITGSNTSSLSDILKLLQYIYFKRLFLLDVTKGASYTTYSGLHTTELINLNKFVSNPRLVGIQSGKTTAGEDVVSLWNLTSPSGDVPVAIILVGSENGNGDTSAIIKWIESSVELK